MAELIVTNKKYLKLEDIASLKSFSIYETTKNTHILVKNVNHEHVSMYYPKKDRLPWKTVEGKKICQGKKIFDSSVDSLETIDTTKWNNGNQILCYEEFSNF